MNFYKAQDHAKRTTRRLVFLFAIAVIALVVITEILLLFIFGGLSISSGGDPIAWIKSIDPRTALIVAGAVVAMIGGASLVRWMQLRGGGSAVANGLGGRRIQPDSQDPCERKVLNVVEEMAIASGIPVPPVYLLEEPSINAFAAGHRIDNAVIGVTRGCIEQLSRDELQGVMAHEFSHIVHGDMRLNIRLMSVLNGILFISIIGNYVVRGSALSSRRNNNAAGNLALGLGLIAIGYIGVFFGNLIKASVSRQREYLADASAVQFTRNPKGISGALKKIGGFTEGTEIKHPRAQEASHMFFGSALNLSSMLATHPPLDQRIKRIDPSFNGKFEPVTAMSSTAAAQAASAFSGNAQVSAMHSEADLNASSSALEDVFDIEEHAGAQAIDNAAQIVTAIPETLKDIAHDISKAEALVIAIIDEDQAASSLSWYSPLHAELAQQVSLLDSKLAIPLLEIATGTLRGLNDQQLEQFKQSLVATIKADQQISFREWCLYQVIREPLFPMAAGKANKAIAQRMADAAVLVAAMAYQGSDAKAGFSAAMRTLGHSQALPAEPSLRALDQAIARLKEVRVLELPKLLKAMMAAVSQDGNMDAGEYELLRAVCAALETPLPPLSLN